MRESNIKDMDHTAVLSDFGRIVISTSKPKEGKIALRLIRFTGKGLADLRVEFNKEQIDMAKALPFSQSLISLFENGKQVPKDKQLIMLQDYFSDLAGYKIVFYFDHSPEQKKNDPDEYWGAKP